MLFRSQEHRAAVAVADPQHAFPGQGRMKPERLEIARLRREVAKLKAVCHGCGEKYRRWCEQECGRLAYGYGMDPHPQGWAGWYCQTCMNALKFHCVDVIRGA